MKQYDKILIPSDNPIPEDSTFNIIYVLSYKPTELSNVIVLTIKELREIYDEGYDDGKGQVMEMDSNARKIRDQSFTQYLKSKGITTH